MDHRGEDGGAVDDRGVDDLALPRWPARAAARRPRRARGTLPRRRSRRAGSSAAPGARPAGRWRPARRSARCSRCRARRCAPAGRSAPSRSSARRPARGWRPAASSGPSPEPLHHARAEALEQHVGPRPPARGPRARSSGSLRSRAIERLPRSSSDVPRARRAARRRAPRRSMRTTSAPRSASSIPQNGPARARRTRRPARPAAAHVPVLPRSRVAARATLRPACCRTPAAGTSREGRTWRICWRRWAVPWGPWRGGALATALPSAPGSWPWGDAGRQRQRVPADRDPGGAAARPLPALPTAGAPFSAPACSAGSPPGRPSPSRRVAPGRRWPPCSRRSATWSRPSSAGCWRSRTGAVLVRALTGPATP